MKQSKTFGRQAWQKIRPEAMDRMCIVEWAHASTLSQWATSLHNRKDVWHGGATRPAGLALKLTKPKTANTKQNPEHSHLDSSLKTHLTLTPTFAKLQKNDAWTQLRWPREPEKQTFFELSAHTKLLVAITH